MTRRRTFLDRSPGEARGVVLLDGRPERLFIERDGEEQGPRLGERHRARVEELSPGLSAFWGTVFLILVMLTQRPIVAAFRREGALAARLREGIADLIAALEAASRNMTSVGIATATAGIIVGTVALTGIGLVMTEIVETASGGNLMIMLLLTALICLILGIGMPTTANYVVVATLMAPVLVEVAQQNDLAVPLVAVHMFVFYFGLMADVHPPVGLAAYAPQRLRRRSDQDRAAGVLVRDPHGPAAVHLHLQHRALLIDVGDAVHFVLVVGCAIVAMGCFVAATRCGSSRAIAGTRACCCY